MTNIKLFGIAMLAVVLSACGGGSGSSGASPSSQANASSTPSNNQSSAQQVSSANGAGASSEGGNTSAGTSSAHGNSSQNDATSSTGDATSSTGGSQSSLPSHPDISNDCIRLSFDTSVNWRDMPSLQTDQEIVECLSTTLGRPVGFGENAKGGYDPNGNSKLTVIVSSHPEGLTVEEQIEKAVTGEEHNWIVFDKVDFSQPYEIGLYRLHCGKTALQTMLGATEEQCVNYQSWCNSKGISDQTTCLNEFFNKALNKKDLKDVEALRSVRNLVVGSNKTLDGRMSEAYFLFSGFSIGRDSSGTPTQTASSVIFTNLNFQGAGHTEDHYWDPDMIRSTGASHDIWIHKNTFDTTGDSAFDVKVGAYNITMSFNKVQNVIRATLHGCCDGHTIDEQITTTMHHNLFVTEKDSYKYMGNTGRRVPLMRRATTHMFNNVFQNYRKEVISLRKGATAILEDNAFLVDYTLKEKSSETASLAELQKNLLRDVRDGSNLKIDRTYLWFTDGYCRLRHDSKTDLMSTSGNPLEQLSRYSQDSQAAIAALRLDAGQDLVDYVAATAGKHGEMPFNSPLANSIDYVLGLERCSGEPVEGGGSSGGSSSSAPEAPQEPSLEVSNFVAGQLTVTWPSVANANSYTLRYGTSSDVDEDFTEVGGVTSPYVIEGLDDATTYYIFLRAYGVSGYSEWAEAESTTIDPTLPPIAPNAPNLRGGDEQIRASWAAVPGATSYELIYNTDDSEAGATPFAGNPVFGNSATITNLLNDTTYYVFVRANNDNGSSDYSPGASATPSEAEPASCYVDDLTGTFGTLSTDGTGQVNSFEWSGRRIDYGSGVLKSNNSEGVGIGFFAEQSEFVALKDIGDRIRLVADFRIPSATRQLDLTELRIALVQSIGDRPVAGTVDIGTTPSWSTPYKAILGSTAYNSRSGETVSAGSMGVYERNQSNSRPMGDNSVAGYASLSSGGESYSTGSGLAAEPLSLVLDVELVDDGKVDITFSHNHNGTALSSMTISDHTTTTLAFDGVGVFFRRNGHIEFDRFMVEHMPAGNTESPCN